MPRPSRVPRACACDGAVGGPSQLHQLARESPVQLSRRARDAFLTPSDDAPEHRPLHGPHDEPVLGRVVQELAHVLVLVRAQFLRSPSHARRSRGRRSPRCSRRHAPATRPPPAGRARSRRHRGVDLHHEVMCTHSPDRVDAQLEMTGDATHHVVRRRRGAVEAERHDLDAQRAQRESRSSVSSGVTLGASATCRPSSVASVTKWSRSCRIRASPPVITSTGAGLTEPGDGRDESLGLGRRQLIRRWRRHRVCPAVRAREQAGAASASQNTRIGRWSRSIAGRSTIGSVAGGTPPCSSRPGAHRHVRRTHARVTIGP